MLLDAEKLQELIELTAMEMQADITNVFGGEVSYAAQYVYYREMREYRIGRASGIENYRNITAIVNGMESRAQRENAA